MKLSQFIVTMMVCYVLTISFSVPSQASKIDPGTIVEQWLFDEDQGDKTIEMDMMAKLKVVISVSKGNLAMHWTLEEIHGYIGTSR